MTEAPNSSPARKKVKRPTAGAVTYKIKFRSEWKKEFPLISFVLTLFTIGFFGLRSHGGEAQNAPLSRSPKLRMIY